MEIKHEVVIVWSDEDDAFIANVPALPGCMTHGSTRADARRNIEEAYALWLDTAHERGRVVPDFDAGGVT
ncbi:MAG TPA: type II toxin-antitoxin system HicB family antitoxin [Thermoanaerobaculia bacterium]|jgi:predicted RNase H-like HicB family nuclease|nr:type II toxin-antitoxin system HicB family antitoxin [Thermoanaerobaculia bacterium]